MVYVVLPTTTSSYLQLRSHQHHLLHTSLLVDCPSLIDLRHRYFNMCRYRDSEAPDDRPLMLRRLIKNPIQSCCSP
ncbi:hypothetical protein E2C01_056533 [Portunus trituberculatus]|uniref:Uncharacterized protein n=1 Tax=Portunus trituberculatus TaxID=210409 RepID=A0A5B7GZU2_PORTR|nr:hypothetical protein [Portunus trituberculatus]